MDWTLKLYSSWHLKCLNDNGKLKKNGRSIKEEALDDEDLEDHKPAAKKLKGELLYMTRESTNWLTCCSGRFSNR